MNKQELIDHIASQGPAAGLTRLMISRVLDGLAEAVTFSLLADDGEVTLPGLGKLAVKTRAPRVGRNPVTGEEIAIAASRAPVFKAAKGFKGALNR